VGVGGDLTRESRVRRDTIISESGSAAIRIDAHSSYMFCCWQANPRTCVGSSDRVAQTLCVVLA